MSALLGEGPGLTAAALIDVVGPPAIVFLSTFAGRVWRFLSLFDGSRLGLVVVPTSISVLDLAKRSGRGVDTVDGAVLGDTFFVWRKGKVAVLLVYQLRRLSGLSSAARCMDNSRSDRARRSQASKAHPPRASSQTSAPCTTFQAHPASP